MKSRFSWGAGTLGILGGLCLSWGGQQARQTITLGISSYSVLGVSRDPGPLLIEQSGAGGTPQEAQDRTSYLQYSSTVSGAQKRAVTVQWESAVGPPEGCALRLEARPSSRPNEGRGAGMVTLSDAAQVLIEDIGSCATGVSGGEGALLIYRLTVVDPTRLISGETKSLRVVFTLTDAH